MHLLMGDGKDYSSDKLINQIHDSELKDNMRILTDSTTDDEYCERGVSSCS